MRKAIFAGIGGLGAALLVTGAVAAVAQSGEPSAAAPAPPAGRSGTPQTGYANSFQCIPDSASAPARTYQIISAGKDSVPARPAPTSPCGAGDSGAAASAAPKALTGETEPLNVGLVVPAVQSARDYAPPKKPAPKPDAPRDDCMSCDD